MSIYLTCLSPTLDDACSGTKVPILFLSGSSAPGEGAEFPKKSAKECSGDPPRVPHHERVNVKI